MSETDTDPLIYTGIVRDITDLKDAEQRALLTERLAAIGEMSTGLAHESRNALQRSQSCLEMLALNLKGMPESLKYVARIQAAQDYLLELYENVKEYAGDIRLTRELGNPVTLIEDAWQNLEKEHRDRKVTFLIERSEANCDCWVDQSRLTQVFQNILANALQACKDPVEIVATLFRPEPDAGLNIVRVSIRNNGPSLTPEECSRVFKSFYTTKTHGTGLGLSISRRIVEAHGGTIEVQSSEGHGVEFIITLPIDKP